ncbi:hypothetical protein SAMN04488503_1893 [Humidesulfovibrio mexicanus]|uniref:Uncharacterized protein n=1 Tax=Humidesulfovibrio mexicanus TaxID=147047 RepID=A0A239A856_9BACT|nr:hypothetical protein [Humidesulfovibrio mexicanus]SNR91622.1 hypothetical protein SAMN04488503_1893 [Humidesulfovibrio mexicanus]
MGGKTVKNILLGLAACLCMIALGWVAAKIAGPPAAHSAAQESQAPTRGFFARLFDRSKRFDLSGLKAWEGKPPHEEINGQMLFDHSGFTAAFKETLGEERYRRFVKEAKPGSIFFGMSVERDGRVLRYDVMSFTDTQPFVAVIFMDPEEGFIDAVWNEGNPGQDARAEMFLHTGEHFPVDLAQVRSGLEHSRLASEKQYAAYLEGEQAKFLGVWSGTFYTRASRTRIHTTRTITVTGDPTKINGLRYKQVELMETSQGIFTCNRSSTLSRTFEGVANVYDGVAVFSPKSMTEPQCGDVPPLKYTYDNGVLVRERAAYPRHEGELCEPLRKVE